MEKALENCEAMMDTLPQKYLAKAWLFSGLLHESLNLNEASAVDFEKAIKSDESSARFLQKRESICLSIFPQTNRLCTLFPFVELHFPNRPVLVFFNFHKNLIEN